MSTFTHTRRLAPALCAAAALALTCAPALAFKEAGHRAIEAAAYRTFLDDGEGTVLSTLIEQGILNPPARPLPAPTVLLDPESADTTVDSLVVASHFPDHLFDRQLEADRQCFHFNARGGHYKLSDTTYGKSSIPIGLVEDAYIECIGVADAILRGVLFDPRASQAASNGVYTLMHIVEDSYADSHVARDEHWKILYVKPWNLRTWTRYFLGNKEEAAVYSHFSAEHHMGSDMRDLGYLIGPTDENYEARKNDPQYRAAIVRCVTEGSELIRRHRQVDYIDHPITILDMQGELVVPPVCLSERALQASRAVADLLRMLARLAPHVVKVASAGNDTEVKTASSAGVSLATEWRDFRRKYLAHYDPYLTDYMAARRPRGAAPPQDLRGDRVFSSKEFIPRQFAESAVGLTTELRSGTPLWLGVEEFASRKTSSHNRPVLLLDSLGWGVQVRLPIPNEFGEKPVGVALDGGLGLPLPLSELIGVSELQIYVGARARIAYTAQSVFEEHTRHTFEFGFGGLSADFVVGQRGWFGLDAPRAMYQYDFWDRSHRWLATYWSFSGGGAIDAF